MSDDHRHHKIVPVMSMLVIPRNLQSALVGPRHRQCPRGIGQRRWAKGEHSL